MDRIGTFRASGEAQRAASDETVVNGAHDAHQAIRSGAENPAASVDRRDAPIAEEIKRRQVSLTVRYVAALRAR
jgi:hypothetical protein